MPALNFFRMVATRTMKNSSRLVPTMARNFTRSRSGCDGSWACASTRRLNSSQLISRLMYREGDVRSAGSRLAQSTLVEPSTCEARLRLVAGVWIGGSAALEGSVVNVTP